MWYETKSGHLLNLDKVSTVVKHENYIYGVNDNEITRYYISFSDIHSDDMIRDDYETKEERDEAFTHFKSSISLCSLREFKIFIETRNKLRSEIEVANLHKIETSSKCSSNSSLTNEDGA